MRNLRKPT